MHTTALLPTNWHVDANLDGYIDVWALYVDTLLVMDCEKGHPADFVRDELTHNTPFDKEDIEQAITYLLANGLVV